MRKALMLAAVLFVCGGRASAQTQPDLSQCINPANLAVLDPSSCHPNVTDGSWTYADSQYCMSYPRAFGCANIHGFTIQQFSDMCSAGNPYGYDCTNGGSYQSLYCSINSCSSGGSGVGTWGDSVTLGGASIGQDVAAVGGILLAILFLLLSLRHARRIVA